MKAMNVVCGLVLGLVMAGATGLQAQGRIVALQGWTGGINYNWGATTGFTFGWQFQVNQPIVVQALGVNDIGTYGNVPVNSDSHQVGIWTESGDLVATTLVTFPSGTPNAFVWSDLLAPVNLSVGTYRIGAFYAGPATDTFVYQATSVTMATAITYLNSACSGDAAFSFPNYTGWYPSAFFGPNFQYTTVPEPSVWALVGLGGLTVAAWRRRGKA